MDAIYSSAKDYNYKKSFISDISEPMYIENFRLFLVILIKKHMKFSVNYQ